MSQVGGFIYTIKPGASWALVAHTALNHSGDRGTGAGGIMAASSDIAGIIMGGGIDSLFIFPDTRLPAGLYLWVGAIEEDGACIGHGERLHPDCMQHWIDHNGTTP